MRGRTRMERHGWLVLGPLLGAVTVILCTAPGCAESNELGGSIGELLPLDYDGVRIRKQQSHLLVEYIHRANAQSEKPCKLVVDLSGMESESEAQLTGNQFSERVALLRTTLANDRFPSVESGRLDIQSLNFVDFGHAEGEFSMTFVGGRSLRGKFSHDIEEVPVP